MQRTLGNSLRRQLTNKLSRQNGVSIQIGGINACMVDLRIEIRITLGRPMVCQSFKTPRLQVHVSKMIVRCAKRALYQKREQGRKLEPLEPQANAEFYSRNREQPGQV